MCYRAGVAAMILGASIASAAGPGLPPGWESRGEAYSFAIDLSTRHGGKSCGSIRSQPGAGRGDSGGYEQYFRADNYRGKRVRFSGWMKASDLGDGSHAGMGMKIDGREKVGLALSAADDRKPIGRGWARSSVVLDVPQDAEEISVGFSLFGRGRVWVDDAALEVVSPDVPTTRMDIEPMDRAAGNFPPLRVGLPLEPRGLGFEP